MRRLGLMFLVLLLPIGSARSQVRVRSGIGIEIGLPGVRIRTHGHGHGHHRRVVRHYPRRGRRVVAPRHHVHARSCYRYVRERVWVPAVCEYRPDARGRYYRVIVSPGYYSFETRRIRVCGHD